MALELERLKITAAKLDEVSPQTREHYLKCALVAFDGLADDLPALNESDRAAVSWYIAQLLASMRDLTLARAGDVITDTAVGYSLAACKLVGILA